VNAGLHAPLTSNLENPIFTMAVSNERRREAMGYFTAGRLTVQFVVEGFRRYPRYKYRHQMWDRLYPFHIDDCLECLSESKMVELLQAAIADEPDFPLLRSRRNSRDNCVTFLYVALLHAWDKGYRGLDPNEGTTSYAVLRLLMVPGITRKYSSDARITPLQQACEISGLDVAVLNHLIDLDPGALLLTSEDSEMPLHAALKAWTPASSAVVARMVELAPKALFHQNRGIGETPGFTPILFAASRRALSPDLARFLHRLVEQHPGRSCRA
jgi:hypothetical protein